MQYFKLLRKNLALLAGLFVISAIVGYFALAYANVNTQLLEINSIAPNFKLTAHDGTTYSLEDFKGKKVVLVFYPLDNTPGCTAQLCALRDGHSRLQSLNTTVLASNPGSIESHAKFAKQQQYKFPLLSDSKRKMAKAYHVSNAFGINARTVYIIDEDSEIRFAERGAPNVDDLVKTLLNINSQKSNVQQQKNIRR